MPLDGNGNFDLPTPEYPAIPDDPILADSFNTIVEQIAAALSNIAYKDGQGKVTTLTAEALGATLSGIWNATTQAQTDDSTRIATTAYVQLKAFNAALPSQLGNSGKLVTTDGANASWKALYELLNITEEDRNSNTILVKADSTKLINITGNTFTQTFSACATLGAGWYCFYQNSGTGDITLDPNGAELIDGLASFIMYPKEVRLIICTGTALKSILIKAGSKVITTTGPFIEPPGISGYVIDLIAGGGGGGSGSRKAAGAARGGGSGGGAGARVIRTLEPQGAGTSITVTIGAGGTGAAAIGVDATDGGNGTAGGNTSFGTLITAYGGGRGGGGQGGGNTAGGAGGGSGSAGENGTIGDGTTLGGNPRIGTANNNISFGGGGCDNTSTGCAEFGGAAGGFSPSTNVAGGDGGGSIFGPAGGGAGGGLDAANTERTGGAGGTIKSYTTGGGGAAGAITGGDGGNGTDSTLESGTGGGGGGSRAAGGRGGNGGNGGIPGAGGGGGGASVNGQNSGAGGNGARGEVRIKWY